ncbi:MAG: zinc ribbon domain-containing protein [Candidatus Jordarchaeaceae archaeon]
MINLSYETDYSPEEIIAESTTRLKGRYRLNRQGDILIATAGRDYNTWVIVACVILCFLSLLIGLIILIVYYFTRTQNRITIQANEKGKFTIMYEGKKATEDSQGLINLLRSGKAQMLLSTKCPNCGAQIVEGGSYCTECGKEINYR